MVKVQIYDTTLRDGAQAVDINLTAEDKMRIALKLDELGVDYIEGGWPGSNPTDKRFFEDVQGHRFKHARIAAFGSTHNPKNTAETDPNLKGLVASRAPVLTIFGKTWDQHVTEALRVDLPRNLELIENSLAWLKPQCKELFFDAEHFFDGFRINRE
ncbi:MAG: citramalate synthase, partial [Acidobacteriota bacterium]